MRRLIAVLVLLGGGCSLLSALGCPIGDPTEPSRVSAGPVDGGDPHRHHVGGPEATTESSPSPAPHHPDSDCRLLITCAGALITAPKPSMASERAPSRAAPVSPADQIHAAVFINHDPPPPRLPV